MEITLFSPHYGQKKIIEQFADSPHKFGVVSTGRQFGKSLLAQNLLLYWLLKTGNQKGAWITPVYNQAKKVFNELTNASNAIITRQNKADLTIEFINGSTVQFLSTDNYNTIRGFSFNYMVLDEAAFIKEEAINEAVMPTLSALGKKCLIISTPKGKNWFYNYYLKGSIGSDEIISFRGISTDNPHIDQTFIDGQRNSLPESIFNQEYMAEFTEAGNDVFTNVDIVCNINDWDVPSRNKRYYFGIDSGLTHDFSVLTILDESGRVAKIVRVNGIPLEEIGRNFTAELKRYSVVGGYVETNSIGRPMFELIQKEIRVAKEFTTTNDSKNQGIRNLIYKIQQGELELPSDKLFPQLKQELNAYSYKVNSNGLVSFNAPNGFFDDCVISLMLAVEAREKLLLKKSSLYIGGKKTNEAQKVLLNWGV